MPLTKAKGSDGGAPEEGESQETALTMADEVVEAQDSEKISTEQMQADLEEHFEALEDAENTAQKTSQDNLPPSKPVEEAAVAPAQVSSGGVVEAAPQSAVLEPTAPTPCPTRRQAERSSVPKDSVFWSTFARWKRVHRHAHVHILSFPLPLYIYI